MRMNCFSFILAFILAGCVRSPCPPSVPVENDTSIRFSPLFEDAAVEVGAPGETYEMDGVLLRAITVAANDFLPPGGKNRPCEYTQEAQRYRALRQGDIILVYIYENHEYCGFPYPSLDSGAKYAISTDGRILRRVIDGEPEEPLKPIDLDAGGWGPPSRPGISPDFDARWNRHDAGGGVPDSQDGGAGPSAPVPPAGPSSTPDGGTPAVQ